jgi:hypothetical protein
MRRLLTLFLLSGIIICCSAQSALETDSTGWKNIMPGPGLEGWTRLAFQSQTPMDVTSQWSLNQDGEGTLLCEGDRGHEWLRYEKELSDFILHVEFRFTPIPAGKGYNSGIFIRNSADGVIWHQGQVGAENSGFLFGSTLVNGQTQRVNTRAQLKENRVKPAGEWNVFEARAQGPKISLWVNGAVNAEIEQTDVKKGFIGLEAEGYRIEFRNLKLKELN